MAATRRKRRVSRAGIVRGLPWLAAGLGALVARDARAQSSLDLRYLFYKESGGRTEVQNPTVLLNQDFGQRGGRFTLLVGYDTISGASPTGGYPVLDAQSSASGSASSHIPMAGYHDTRKSGTVSYSRKFGAHLPVIDLSYSKENDYLSRGVGFSDSWTVAHQRGTLHLAASFLRDVVTPVTTRVGSDKASDGIAGGFTWIVGERSLFDVTASLMRLSGYLDDPYKVVPVGTGTLPEHRPDTRARWAVIAKWGHHFDQRGAIRSSYRYYWDDWGIRAHTLELDFDQHVGRRWIVSPQARLYTQTGASFYAKRLETAREFMSADYRVSPFQSVLGGLTLSYVLRDGLSLSVGVTGQRQNGRDRVQLASAAPVGGGDDGEGGGVSSVSAADMTVVTGSVGLSWRF